MGDFADPPKLRRPYKGIMTEHSGKKKVVKCALPLSTKKKNANSKRK